MTRVRTFVFPSCLLLTATLILGCGDSDPVAPTVAATTTTPPAPAPAPAPTPAPAPPAPTYTVSGTVSETAPTASRRVPGVLVTTSDGASATTDNDGAFTLSGVLTGTQTLRFAKAEFDTGSATVTVSNDVSGVQVNLSPTPRIVDTGAIDALIGPDDPSCSGTSRPCDVYQVGAHHDGAVQVFVTWADDDTELDLEVRCDDQFIEESTRKGTLDEINTQVKGGRACELHLIHRGGPTQPYRIFLKYPY